MKIKRVLTATSIIVFIIAIIGVLFFLISSFRMQKLSCTSQSGDITITYDDQGITGYTASAAIKYDLVEQQDYAKRIGIEEYLAEFTGWFEASTNGICQRQP